MMRLFGTDGLRGRAGEFPLDSASILLVGREVGRRAAARDCRRVVLGGDTRESTAALVARLASGIAQAGVEAACAGIVPTPAVAELTLALGAGAGISVSASHNPYEDNGIKIFGSDGRKWPDEEEERLEDVLFESEGRGEEEKGGKGENSEWPPVDARLAEIYLERLAAHVPARLDGLAVLMDTGNGAAFRVGPEALERAGARVTAVCDRPDGRNINAGCGALHPEGMAGRTRAAGVAMGVAFDGDADRSIFADETGRILDGDDVLWIVARDWKSKGLLAAGGVVGTVMSNYGLEAALAAEGIAFRRAAVGDRNVARVMEEEGASLGGETSGHVIFPFSPAGDGIQTSLVIASILAESGRPLSGLATLEKTPQALRNVRVERRVPLEETPAISRAVARAREALDRRGRVYLRYSGTEPLLRILVEGPEEQQVLSIANDLEAAARKELA